jgi:two-component system invasion response regulator UvrY
MIRVLVADDHAVIREGLRRILEEHADLKVVAEAGTSDELMAALAGSPADVLVLDVSMPGPGVFAVLERLKAERPRLRCVVLTVHPADQYALRVLRAGAAGFLTKEQSTDLLVAAIRKVYSGGVYLSPSLADLLAADVARPRAGEPHEALSAREFEVLVRIAGGQSIKAIAADLSLSPKTVSTYHSRIRRKLGLQSDADLIRYALEQHLTT